MYNFPYMRTFLIIIVILFASYAQAQEANDVFIERTTAFAIGQTQRLDTYLSNEEYRGSDYRFISNVLRIRPNSWDFQFTHEGTLDYTHNRVDNANTLAGHYDFAFAMMKRLDKIENGPFTLRAGFMSDLYAGFAYNMRNSANNPAQGYASLSLGGTAMGTYRLKIGEKTLPITYEMRIPIIGIMFSPAYGQSYYELFNNGNYDNNIVMTSIAIPQYRHQLSIDYPINERTYIRIGYLGDYRQSKPNELKQHTYTNSFLIGFVLRK